MSPEELDAYAAQFPYDSESSAVQLAVSTVILALRENEDGESKSLWLPLVRRLREPYQGMFALPGGPLPPQLSLRQAAGATLKRATGLEPGYLEQLYAFGEVDRAPAGSDAPTSAHQPATGDSTTVHAPDAEGVVHPAERVVSMVYWASLPEHRVEQARVHENIQWMPVDELPQLAFDHNTIVDYALFRLRRKVEHSRIAHSFLGEEFTLAQLRQVYEAILGRPLDPANFRRQIAASKSIIDTGRRVEGTRHRPPRLYRYDHSKRYTDQGPLGR